MGLRGGEAPEVRPGAHTPRPRGALVWCHVPDPARLPAALRLARDMATEGDQISLLVTCDRPGGATAATERPLPRRLILTEPPPDHAAAVRGFVEHWQPDAFVWLGGALKPRTLATVGKARVPMILADAGDAALRSQGGLWRARLPRATLNLFSNILCIDGGVATRLKRAELSQAEIEVRGLIDEGHTILPCHDGDRVELAAALASRPRWLAVDPERREFAALAAAHRIASHRSHRLILLLAADDTAAAASYFGGAGFATADRAMGQEPSEATEILISDTAELGVFYRMAPVAFLGGTLGAGARRDPFEAASLGSALLHGPKTAPYEAAMGRLDAAGAARAVRSGDELGATLERLLSPDRAAQLAHAAWEVASEGAEAANRLLTLLRAATDRAPLRRG